ncbi:MAG TPA: hypothetical protein PKV98_04630 [Burkholderiaceae bacterium]|nr:hypothetical protein [Burkholderiaceae bacterium]
MKVNFSEVINNLQGSPIQVPDGEKTKDCTLAYVAAEALLAFDPQVKESGETKAKSYALAVRLVKGGEQEVSAEDIVLLKNKIGDTFAPAVVGPCFELLEQRAIGEA